MLGFPSVKSIAVDPLATNWSIAVKNAPNGYLAREVLKEISTNGKQTGTFHIWDTRSFLRTASQGIRPTGKPLARALGGERVRGKQMGSTTSTYKAEEFAFELPLDRRMASRADNPLRLRQAYQEIVVDMLLFEAEQRMIDLAFATATVTQNTTLSGTTQWSDYDNSSPIGNILTALDTIGTGALLQPGIAGYELCAMTRVDVWRKLQRHPELQTQLGANERKTITEQAFKEFFNIDHLHIHRVGKDTAKEGQTSSIGYMLSDDFLLYYRPKAPMFEMACFGLLPWEQDVVARTYEEPQINSDVLVADHSTDEILPFNKAGYLFKDCLA